MTRFLKRSVFRSLEKKNEFPLEFLCFELIVADVLPVSQ